MRSPCCSILVALVILPLPSSKAFAQTNSAGSGAAAPQASPREADPELAAIDEAEREGHMVDAEKLLKAAITSAEAHPGNGKRLSRLLSRLPQLEENLGHNAEALSAATKALETDKKIFGPESGRVANDLFVLSMFNRTSHKSDEAEKDLKQALAIGRVNPGPRSVTLLSALWNLGAFYSRPGHGSEAVPLMLEGLQLCGKGPHLDAISCDSFRLGLAQAYRSAGRPKAAEQVAADAVAADLSADTPWRKQVADMDNLARQYEDDKSYDLAETSRRQAAALIEKNARPQDAVVLLPDELDQLGKVLVAEGENTQAEEIFNRSFSITEAGAGAGRKDLAGSLSVSASFLENLYRSEGRTAEMEPLLERVLAVQEKILDPTDARTSMTLGELVWMKVKAGDYSGAAPLCEQLLKIQESNYGPDSLQSIVTMEDYSSILQHLGENEKADALAARAAALRKQAAGARSH